MVYHYDLHGSWFAYQKTVEITKRSGSMVDEDTGVDNFNPIIEMRVADPDGNVWNQDYL